MATKIVSAQPSQKVAEKSNAGQRSGFPPAAPHSIFPINPKKNIEGLGSYQKI